MKHILVTFFSMLAIPSLILGQTKSLNTPLNSPAQERNPSLIETFEWLKAQFDHSEIVIGSADNLRVIKYRLLQLDKCTLVWRLESFNAGKFIIYEYKVHLADLDPSNITVKKDGNNWQVILNTYNKKSAIKSRKVEESKLVGDELNFYDFSFFIEEEALTRRIAKALSHTVEMCGGKKEPF